MASTYLQRTMGTPTSRKKFTISVWVKKSKVGSSNAQHIWNGYYSTDNRLVIYFQASGADTLGLYNVVGGSATGFLLTNRKFRDPNAWYHIYYAVDTTQSTANDRFKLYVNGVQETSFSTTNNPSQNDDLGLNFQKQVIGYNSIDNNSPYDGNMCEIVIQDGVASAPTDFGEFSDTGQWIPIDPTGVTFGTNGAYLNFADSSTMGNDASGGTDFTGTNLNSTDLSEDTCTNNFSTLNYNTGYLQGTATSFTAGNVLRQGVADNFNAAVGTQGINPFVDAKWYFEVECPATSNGSSIDVGYGWMTESIMVSGSHANTDVYSAGTSRYVFFANSSAFCTSPSITFQVPSC